MGRAPNLETMFRKIVKNRENLGKNLEISKYGFVWGSGGCENLKIISRKINGNLQNCESFEKNLRFTYKNLNGKLIFYPCSLPSSTTFVILYTSGTS